LDQCHFRQAQLFGYPGSPCRCGNSSTFLQWGKISDKVQNRSSILKSITGPGVILGLVCAVLAGLGYEAFGAVVGPFLQSLGYSKVVVGWFYTFSLFAMGAGSLLGGKIADRIGHYRVYLFSILAIFAVIGVIVTAAQTVPHLQLLNIALGLAIYFFIGVMISSSYAFFMDISDRSTDKATTFSLIMAGTNACEAIASFGIGRLIPMLGYPIAFFVMGVFSLVSVPFLKMNREKAD
jgi:MFS family permease